MTGVNDVSKMDWSDISPSFIRYPWVLYKNRQAIDYWFKKFQVLINTGSTNIAVLGRENVGKSVFLQQLCNEAGKISFELPTTSKSVENDAVFFGDWSKIVSVIPGQSSKERYEGLQNVFENNPKLEGIIYLSDWGYTDIRDNILRQSMVERDGIKTIQQLRAFNLASELSDFEQINQLIIKAHHYKMGPKWVIVLANKCDLFYDSINEAQKYYHLSYESDFNNKAKALLNKVGAMNLAYRSLPICSWQTDFEWNNHRIKTDLGGNEVKQSLFKNLIFNISELSK
jgi:50S ribosome-binding GTPase